MIQQNAFKDIDLKNYDLVVKGASGGYFELAKDGSNLNIFYGQPGELQLENVDKNDSKGNIFKYFKVPLDSKAGILSVEYHNLIKKAENRKTQKQPKNKRAKPQGDRLKLLNGAFEKREQIIQACKEVAIETLTGSEAFSKYWNLQFLKSEKIGWAFQIVYSFEALKDWYAVNLEYFINENNPDFINEAIRESEIEQWIENIADDVRTFVITSGKKSSTGRSSISKFHANELIKFYDWVVSQQGKINNSSGVETTGFESYLKNTSVLPALIEKYKGSKPTVIMCMVFSLSKLGLFNQALHAIVRKDLHTALTFTFGPIVSKEHLRSFK